jgi:uncharacterized protein (TIGR00297 family)
MTSATATLLGAVTAAGIAGTAWRLKSLSASGAAAATLLGIVASAAGTDWAALLVLYFVSSSALSRAGASAKARRTAGVVAKGGARDATQVLANGGAFGLAAVAMLVSPSLWPAVAAAGALAASAADTWATEFGTWRGGTPRHVLTWQPLAPGMSGGVTVVGTLAMVVGAAAVAGTAVALGWPASAAPAVLLGGIAGAVADSVLGATVQERRRCPTCDVSTEQPLHACGTLAPVVGGWPGVSNDAVNAAATGTGALVAVLLMSGT